MPLIARVTCWRCPACGRMTLDAFNLPRMTCGDCDAPMVLEFAQDDVLTPTTETR